MQELEEETLQAGKEKIQGERIKLSQSKEGSNQEQDEKEG